MKKRISGALCALILFLAVILSSCSGTEPQSASFESMDTLMSLKVYGGNTDTCSLLQKRIGELDARLDATDENSEIFQLNTAKSASLSKDTDYLLQNAVSLCSDSDGAFDITVYPAMQAWGFTTGNYRVPDSDELKALAEKINYGNIRFSGSNYSLDSDTQIDLGAVAKGYAADECSVILDENNAQAAILNLGGTICLYGQKPDGSRFTVGIADPENPAGYFGYLSCDAGVVATSGGYERYFEQDGKRYIHILDPQTAEPVDNGVLSVTILCDSDLLDGGTTADALSTALFVMGLDKATAYHHRHKDFDFIILTDSGDLYLTEGVYDDFTLCDGFDYTLNKVA